MTSFETRQVVVDGVRSPVLIGGTGNSDEAVVFVHGNPDAGGDWEPLMERVAEFATVVAPDMPGFGGADKPEDWNYTVAGYASHLGGVLDRLGIEQVPRRDRSHGRQNRQSTTWNSVSRKGVD